MKLQVPLPNRELRRNTRLILHPNYSRDAANTQLTAISTAPAFVDCLVSTLNTDVQQIYARQVEIGREVTAVQEGLSRLALNTSKLADLLASLGTALKQVGDFENYLQVVEGQLDGVAEGVATLLADRKAAEAAEADSQEEQEAALSAQPVTPAST